MLSEAFFAREPIVVAKDLLGKVLRHYYEGIWLSALIIEAEAYYINEKGSHASLGFTEKERPCLCSLALSICITRTAATLLMLAVWGRVTQYY